jgi:light-regulated signal transduction histidine kinase (bacteriophytochrome)
MLQVWVNLIGNAVKYSAKVARPLVEIGITDKDNKTVYYIKDNGAGFDMRHADKLFAAFQRLHGISDFEGSGIGLSTVHRIITRHGGTIWAESEPNKGATFYFTLPQ